MTRHDKATPSTIVWADLAVPDLEKGRAFYGELLGWAWAGGDDANSGFYTTATRGDSRVAALWKNDPSQPGPRGWQQYFGTASADETAAKVKAHGGQVVAGPMDVMEHGRMAMCVDPTGATFGLWQPNQHQGAQLMNEPGAMCWHEVYTRDAEKARDFYGRVFNLEPKRMEGGMEYWTLHRGPDTVAGLMPFTAQQPKDEPSHWNIYFAVSDADAAVAKLEKLGGKVRQPCFDTPFGRMSAVTDPFGNDFCVIKLS